MLLLKQKWIHLNFFLLLSAAAQGQYKFDNPVSLSTKNGLPVNDIRAIVKSDDGFVWIATDAGLCRFDGTQLKIYSEGKDLLHALPDNLVTALLPIKNKLWIGTKQGISILNMTDNTFRHYQLNSKGKSPDIKKRADQVINCFHLDKYNKLWIGTGDRGAVLYDEQQDNFKLFPIPPGKFVPLIPALGPITNTLSLTSSRTNDSLIWAGTAAGLQQINRFTHDVQFFSFPHPVKDYQVGLNAFRRLYHHDNGLLYVGSWAAGVNVFDPAAKTFTPLTARSETGNRILRSAIGGFTRKSDHEFWISNQLGLAIYDTKEKDITWYKLHIEEENKYFFINFIDNANRIWWGDNAGVNYLDPVMQQFTSYSYRKLSPANWTFAANVISDDKGNQITVCPLFTDAIFIFDKTKKEWSKKKFPLNETFIPEKDVVKGFVQLSPGEFVISSDKGIYRYSSKRNTIRKVNAGFPFMPTRRGSLLADRKGNVWITDNTWGLTKWNPANDQFVNYKNETIVSDSTGQLGRLLNLYEDSRGDIWFQSPRGIGVYIAAQDTVYNFVFFSNENNSFPSANSFAEDRSGKVWTCSTDGWIGYAIKDDPVKGIVKKINIRDYGFSGDVVRMTTDNNGDVWAHTRKELIKIRSDNGTFKSFDFQYGAGDADFYHFSFLPSGEMIFGGRNDIIIANPAELKRNAEIPVPYISEIHVLNQPYRDLKNGEPLRLKPKENFFSIAFSSIAFTMPAGVKYRFRLNDFDNWSEPSSRRFASYTNVPGGDYVFQLQACNNEGIWNKTILELPVHIATPFWQTLWFRIGLVLLLALAIYGVYKYRVNQFRKKEKLKSDYEKKIANVEMSSLLAQMNPHFLFNSLNSIDSYIIKNETYKASEYLNNFARLMRLILQNSRSNYISLKDELEALDLYLQMEGLRFKNKFDYEIKVDEKINTGTVLIPPMLIQPFVENAIWHGLMHKQDGEPGKVEIIISEEGNRLKCVVLDNGIGRDKAEEIKMQKTGNRKRSMGMQITSDRIEMINKLYGTDTKVKITDLFDINRNPAGTKVELEIPV